MKIVIQRVNWARVVVADKTIGEIAHGLCLLIGFGKADSAAQLKPMVEKISVMRLFPCEKGRFDKSVTDVGGNILCVPQFTLYADTAKGRRPEFFGALAPEEARALFSQFVETFRANGFPDVQTGEFGAYMKVSLENDGPVTILLSSS